MKYVSRMLSSSLIAGACMIFLVGMKGQGCDGDPGAPAPSMCEISADCSGLPSPDCIGDWSCESGQCNFDCDVKPPFGCGLDSECGETQICVAGECPECPPNALCAPCMGTCQDVIQPPPLECAADSDCQSNHYCDFVMCEDDGQCFGVCKEKWGTKTGCDSDADCSDGHYCSQPMCLLWCEEGDDSCCGGPASGTCEPTQPPSGCEGDWDCGPGMQCAMECMSPGCDCAGDEDCDCPTVEWCTGMCIPDAKPGCNTDDDCGPGATCHHECADLPCFCGDDADECDCQTLCEGTCHKIPEPPMCDSDADCGLNASCEFMCPDIACSCAEGSDDCDCAEPVCQPVCIPKPQPSCEADSSCGPGQTCQTMCTDLPCACDEDEEDCDCLNFWCESLCVDDGTEPPAPAECVVSGCSGEICADQPIDSICIFDPWMKCMTLTTCGPQAGGGCGWEDNGEFLSCLEEALEKGGDGQTPIPSP